MKSPKDSAAKTASGGCVARLVRCFFILPRGVKNACKNLSRRASRHQANGEHRDLATTGNRTTRPLSSDCRLVGTETVSCFVRRLQQNIDRENELSHLARYSGSIILALIIPAIRVHAWCERSLAWSLRMLAQVLGWPLSWFFGYSMYLSPKAERQILDAMKHRAMSPTMPEWYSEEMSRKGRQTQSVGKGRESLDSSNSSTNVKELATPLTGSAETEIKS